MTESTAGDRRLLIAGYFPRAVTLEGVGTFVGGLTDGLRELGWAVRLLLPSGDYAGLSGVEVLTYVPGGLGGPGRYRAALRAARRPGERVLLVENNPNAALLGAPAVRGVPAAWYFYTPLQTAALLPAMGWRLQAAVHAMAKHRVWAACQSWRGRTCIVATDYQAAQLRGCGAAAVHRLPGTTLSPAPAPSRAAARAALGWDDRPTVGYLGHFSPAKGVEGLLEAFMDCPPETALALAYSGKGRLSRAGQERLEALRQAGRLREHGVVVPATFLAACDVVALPYPSSSIHHLPLVLLEAYAAGTAVVTTAVGGLGEVHRDGQYGALVPPRDARALHGALNRLLGDLPACHAEGQAARELFNRSLGRSVFCTDLSRILEGLTA